MPKKSVILSFPLMMLLLIALNARPVTYTKDALDATFQSGSVTPQESRLVALVNGSNAYNYDLELEKIAFNHTISEYSFRAGGSSGANETAQWIKRQFENFGLEAYTEPFEFTNWTLLSQPTLMIDDDGDPATTNDQITIESFQSTHYSWPTPDGGVFADLVVLPLPPAANRGEIGMNPIDQAAWNAVNTTGKVVLIGMEVRWARTWEETYKSKLSAQPPVAVIYTWWYSWMSFTPLLFSSAGGRPISGLGSYYWSIEIPVGGVNYQDSLWIRERENSMNVSAGVKIESAIGYGTHYNVIGKLTGYADPDRFIIVSGHYDTVMCGGFCDNGAGTAGVIELARVFAEAVKRGFYYPIYTILFVAFASEELYLVGSTNYVIQHKAETNRTVAVVNMDCIGSDIFEISETNPAGGLDLDQVVLKAAEDLGVPTQFTEPGSDEYVFKDPVWANWAYQTYWGLNAGIDDATPVESSILLISYPLLYSDQWSMGTPGWIHTSYDNSTSTVTLSWVEVDDLQNHIRVAGLSLMRILPLIGDVDGSGKVDMFDIGLCCIAFLSKLVTNTSDPRYRQYWHTPPCFSCPHDSYCDIDRNGKIDMMDIGIACINYQKTVP